MTTRMILLLVAGFFITSLATSAQPSPPPRPIGRGLTTSSTWTDDDLEKTMKQISPAAINLRKLIDDKVAPAAEAHADTLEHLFDDVEEFFKARKLEDAEKWARAATDHANHVEEAIKGKDFGKASEHLKLLMGMCETCHTKHRERLADGTYQFKKP